MPEPTPDADRVHPEGCDGECPCPPKCGCCKAAPAPERKAKLEGPGADGPRSALEYALAYSENKHRAAPAPAPQLRDQIAAAALEVLCARMGEGEWTHLKGALADAVLAVRDQQLAETRDALRHATGDRDAYDQEQQQLREELAEARGQIERVRQAIAERRTELAEYEAEHEPSGWSDAVSVTCSRIEDALRVFPEPRGIPCHDDPREPS